MEKKINYNDPILASETIIAVGNFGENVNIEYYDIENDKWILKDDLNTGRMSFRSIFFDEKLMLIGGWQDGKRLSDVESYDLSTGELSTMPSMNETRDDFAVAVDSQYLYAFGGFNGNYLSSAERYSNITKEWTYIEPMPTPRYRFEAVTLNDEIFVIGGYNREHLSLSSVEAYNPNGGVWRKPNPMNVPREDPAAAVLNNYLYVFGGHYIERLDSAEKYDSSIDKWNYIHITSIKRSLAQAVDFNGTIVVAGGYAHSEILSFVESYNPDEDSWKTMGSLVVPRRHFDLLRVPWNLVKKSVASKSTH